MSPFTQGKQEAPNYPSLYPVPYGAYGACTPL